MRRKTMAIGVFATLGIALGAWVVGSYWVKRDVEEPAYEVVSRDGAIEVRRYEPNVVAATVVEGERRTALGEAFRRLAGYIFGGNQRRKEIAMTAPVSATPSEKIAMTAPVSATAMDEGRFRVTFTMPSSYRLDTLPVPNDDRVLLEEVPAREVAALRFGGRATDEAVRRAMAEAVAWVEGSGRTMVGAPTLAQYDPPFAAPWMRRNEILVELAR